MVELKRDNDPSEEIVGVDEAISQYGNQWVLMRVTGFDENRIPANGVVVSHHRSRKRVGARHIEEIRSQKERPGDVEAPKYYVFYAQPRITEMSDAVITEALQRASKSRVRDDWRR